MILRLIAWIIWRQLLDIDDGASRVISVGNNLSVQRLILDSNEELGSIAGPLWLLHISTEADAGSGFGLFYPSSYDVASPRALYRVETGGPMGDVEFEKQFAINGDARLQVD